MESFTAEIFSLDSSECNAEEDQSSIDQQIPATVYLFQMYLARMKIHMVKSILNLANYLVEL